MQIHEITLARVDEGVLSTIGQDIKSAVTEPFQKFQAAASEPDGLSSAGGYATAMDKYYRGQIEKQQPAIDQQQAQRLAAQTKQKAIALAQQWTQYLQSKPKPPTRLKSAPTPIKPTGQYATKPPAGQVYGSNYPVKYKSPPPPATQLNAPVTEQDEPVTIGGQTLDPKNPKDAQILAQMRAQGKLPEPPPTQAKPVEPAKTGFAAVAGPTPPPGGQVRSAVTTASKNVLTGSRAQEFRDWANKQLASQVTGTNQTLTLDQVRKADPAVAQQLAQLLPAILMKNDTQAMEQYFTIAMQAMQKLAAATRQSAKSRYGTAGGAVSPLSTILNPGQIEDLQKMFQDPVKGSAARRHLGIK